MPSLSIKQYGTETLCQDALEKARWGKGFGCPKCPKCAKCAKCGDSRHTFFYHNNRKVWLCSSYKHQITLRTETLFHASNSPLRKLFLAICLITWSKTNISALSLKRYLGVGYPAA
jgi:hypothetical protein